MAKEIALRKANELAADTNIFASFLEQFGLPTENIIATTEERNVVATNLPAFLNKVEGYENAEEINAEEYHNKKVFKETMIGWPFFACINKI